MVAFGGPSAYARAQARWQGAEMDRDTVATFAAYQRSIGLAENTIRNRSSILHSLRTSAGRSLLEVDLMDLRLYTGRDGIAQGTRRTERAAIRAFFAFALDEGLRDDDPSARLKPIRVLKGEARPFTSSQVDAMLATGAYRRTRAMILLGAYQGFRVSSIARVRGDDIDLLASTIRTVGKGGKDRVLPLHPMIAELASSMPSAGYWFPARGGRRGHIHPSSVTNLITRAKKRAGIVDPKLTPHSLRHAFGTDLVDEGLDIRVVQDLMMHESLATTQIYTRVSARRKAEGIALLPMREVPQHSGRRMATPPLAA